MQDPKLFERLFKEVIDANKKFKEFGHPINLNITYNDLKAALLESNDYIEALKAEIECYKKDEADKVLLHHARKRCLAMARWCDDRWADIATPYFKSVWYRKWQLRWLAIAEKFKEAK